MFWRGGAMGQLEERTIHFYSAGNEDIQLQPMTVVSVCDLKIKWHVQQPLYFVCSSVVRQADHSNVVQNTRQFVETFLIDFYTNHIMLSRFRHQPTLLRCHLSQGVSYTGWPPAWYKVLASFSCVCVCVCVCAHSCSLIALLALCWMTLAKVL